MSVLAAVKLKALSRVGKFDGEICAKKLKHLHFIMSALRHGNGFPYDLFINYLNGKEETELEH